MESWLTHLGQSDYQVMCIGEFHEESTRNFLAEEFFAKFSVDVLLMEVSPPDKNGFLTFGANAFQKRNPTAAHRHAGHERPGDETDSQR